VINYTRVSNDTFVAIDEDGHVVGQTRMRLYELERFTGIDTDGDGLADRVKPDFSGSRLSCKEVS
jgi:hypothetical protein